MSARSVHGALPITILVRPYSPQGGPEQHFSSLALTKA